MHRLKMRCPFSKQLTRQCPIFRGRHLNLCSISKPDGGSRDSSKTPGARLGSKDDDFEQWKLLERPVMPRSPKWLANIEDWVE
jgi:hypothetical protein